MSGPERIGKYRIRREIGRGSMGIVYEAYDTVIERPVALKVLHVEAALDEPSNEITRRFRREAQAAGRLSSPYIVAVYDFGEDPEERALFIAMELVSGQDLRSHFSSGRRFSLEEATQIIRELLSALQHAHSKGIVHRDIKPANILLQEDGTVKVADFGIAKFDTSELTQTGAVLGTVSHMSPEQLNGLPIDARSDIFSSAVVLYELLTGVRPFTGSAATVMRKVLEAEAVPPSMVNAALPPGLDDVVKQAMSKRAEDRHASAKEFSAAFAKAVSERALVDPAPTTALPPEQPHQQEAKDATQDKAGLPLHLVENGVPSKTGLRAASSDTDRTSHDQTDEIDQDLTIAIFAPRSLLANPVAVEASSAVAKPPAPFAAGPIEKDTSVRLDSRSDKTAEASPKRYGSKAFALWGVVLVAAMAVAWLPLKRPGIADTETRASSADKGVPSAPSNADRASPMARAAVPVEQPMPLTAPAISMQDGKVPGATLGNPIGKPSESASDAALKQRAQQAEQKERKDWAAARKLDTEVAYTAFMKTYPASTLIPAAKYRLTALAKAEAATAQAAAAAREAALTKPARDAAFAEAAAKTATAQAAAAAREAELTKARDAALAAELARKNAADAAATAAARTVRPAPGADSGKPLTTVKPSTELPTKVAAKAPLAESAAPTTVVFGFPDCVDKLPFCQVRIGLAYLNGRGVARDPTKAFDWFKRASDSGDLEGHMELAHLYERGVGVAKNEVLALELAKKASDQGSARAMNLIGNYYRRGVGGLLENKVLAADWYAKSAERGYAGGQVNLGEAYLFGRGVFKDTEKATALFQKAIAQRNGAGYFFFGLMYETGNGKERNVGDALKHYKEALRLGGLTKVNADRALAFVAAN